MGLSLHFRAEWSPGGRISDDAVGQECPKLLDFVLPSSAQTGVPHALTGLILSCLPRDEVLVSPAEPHFSKPSRFLYK